MDNKEFELKNNEEVKNDLTNLIETTKQKEFNSK